MVLIIKKRERNSKNITLAGSVIDPKYIACSRLSKAHYQLLKFTEIQSITDSNGSGRAVWD